MRPNGAVRGLNGGVSDSGGDMTECGPLSHGQCGVYVLVWLAAYVEAHEAGACHYGHDMTDGQGHGRK